MGITNNKISMVAEQSRRYGTYKDSGVEWLGEIPEHWEVTRLKNHMDMITGYPFKSEKYTEEGIKLARGINVKEGILNWKETRYWPKIEDYLIEYLLKDGDILIAMDGSKVGKNFCQIKESDLPILLLQRVARLRPKESITSNYLYFNIVNRNFLLWVEMTKTDPMVPHIAPADIKNFQITIPPLSEQTAIANFLDEKATKIDEAIAIKQQQIELLKERKQIIIHKAVTRGLEDSVPLKDSGVEWIGEIPEHWEKKRLTNDIFIQEGPGIMAVDFKVEGVPLIRISGVKGKTITLDGCNYLNPLKVKRKWNHFKLDKGDLVISGSASTELVSEVDEKAINSILYTGLIRLKIKSDSLFKNYLKIFLGTKLFFTQIDLQKTGSTISHYGPSHLSNMFIILPPTPEQKEIASYIENISKKIETAITLKQQEIAKLQEYKSSLINSVVTGKVRVC